MATKKQVKKQVKKRVTPPIRRPRHTLRKLITFAVAVAIVIAMYLIDIPHLAFGNQNQAKRQATAYSAIEEFIKASTFTSHVYRPKETQPALLSADQAQVFGKIYTSEPVVFLTIDDGVSDDPDAFYMIYKRGVVVTMFLNDNNIKSHYGFFTYWQQSGSTVQNHTISHPHLNNLNHDQQRHEICGNADLLQAEYGKRSTLFRSPFGETNDSANRAVAECNMKANVWWSVVVENGKIEYQGSNKKLLPGDIVLLHFTPHLHSDLQVIFDQIDKDHMQIGQLEDWLH
jgi:peptidoglycan/xylan/chitin deacetylase (PgdA/CDA1 family)